MEYYSRVYGLKITHSRFEKIKKENIKPKIKNILELEKKGNQQNQLDQILLK